MNALCYTGKYRYSTPDRLSNCSTLAISGMVSCSTGASSSGNDATSCINYCLKSSERKFMAVRLLLTMSLFLNRKWYSEKQSLLCEQ